ncbi:hypothetical protein HER32_08225 [Hymenobacter sp. BT18]|uniref:hypothetical protein n=1 Tax=Hymenobacter sp. BT18 TaxID=2835648 RepID=UPI00143EEF1E|nr:hypothetical protein [Hymenobacter sp. BT18]QIX61166.1 hypothetical protein HER32_08225 [Hymenobacter sp. BT18]
MLSRTGDTLRVELENRFWKAGPDRLRYRTTATAPILDVPTRRLRGFGLLSGRQWRVLPLQYDAAAEGREANVMPGNAMTRLQTDTLVTEVLVLGPVTLLSAFEDTTPHYFVLKANAQPLELVSRVISRTAANGSQTLVTINNYREQLRLFLQPDCPAVASGWGSLAYTPAALTRLLSTYNQACLGAPVVRPAKSARRPAVRLDGGVVLGGGPGTGSFANAQSTGLVGLVTGDFQQATLEQAHLAAVKRRQLTPAAGLYLDVLMPGRTLAVHGEAQLALGNSSSHTVNTGFASFPTKTYAFKQGTQLSLLAGLRVFGAAGKGSLLAGGGVLLTRTGFQDAAVTYPQGIQRTYKGTGLPDRRDFTMPAGLDGFYLEAGYRRGRLQGSLAWRRQTSTTSVTDVSTISSVIFNKNTNQVISSSNYAYVYRLSQLQLTVGYRLSPDTDQE